MVVSLRGAQGLAVASHGCFLPRGEQVERGI
jgi:hypothetical protein